MLGWRLPRWSALKDARHHRACSHELFKQLDGVVHARQGSHVIREMARVGAVGRIAQHVAESGADDIGGALLGTYSAPKGQRLDALGGVGWSAVIGITTSGTPSDNASFVLLKPPCVMKTDVRSRTATCGTKASIRTFAGRGPTTSESPIAATTSTGTSATA